MGADMNCDMTRKAASPTTSRANAKSPDSTESTMPTSDASASDKSQGDGLNPKDKKLAKILGLALKEALKDDVKTGADVEQPTSRAS